MRHHHQPQHRPVRPTPRIRRPPACASAPAHSPPAASDPKEYEEVADIIGTALAAGQDADVDALKARVDKLAEDFPLYPGLDQIH